MSNYMLHVARVRMDELSNYALLVYQIKLLPRSLFTSLSGPESPRNVSKRRDTEFFPSIQIKTEDSRRPNSFYRLHLNAT